METVLAARTLMGISLGFHIIYATIGIGLPLLLALAEGLALKTGDELWHAMARRWIRPAALFFAIGAVSGTILSFELGLLWPRFMEFSGPMIGLPFWMEGYAFFTEAIFLALYIYGEKRLSRRAMFLCTIPLALAAAISAVFVISANAWMNTPTGFTMAGGVVTDVRPWQAMANPAWAHEAVHGTFAAYTATGFGLAGVFALALLRGREREYNRRGLTLALAVGTVALPLMLVSGDWAAQFLADHEKAKLAAAEAHFNTEKGAPLVVGGWPNPLTGETSYGIRIPKLLSFLAYRNFDATVTGLNDFPPEDRPDPRMVHPFFDIMVGSFFLMAMAASWFWIGKRRRRDEGKWLLRAILLASPFGMIALEAGWLVTEFGRQPWIVMGYMRTAQGATPNPGIDIILGLFLALYLALTAGLLKMLLRGNGEISGSQEGRRADFG
jgi:cytochrome bd ubiquinol oxidase subunit I